MKNLLFTVMLILASNYASAQLEAVALNKGLKEVSIITSNETKLGFKGAVHNPQGRYMRTAHYRIDVHAISLDLIVDYSKKGEPQLISKLFPLPVGKSTGTSGGMPGIR